MGHDSLRKKIREIINESYTDHDWPEMYLMSTGELTSFGCPKCVLDIEYRIEDAKKRRDDCHMRTDAREHYNGLLKVLRRELRGARKISDNL